MSTIDHKAVAVRLLNVKSQIEAGGTTDEVHVTTQLATAHATLALVEQQRIANLIAHADSLAALMRDGFTLSTQDLSDLTTVHTQIREGLGIS